MRGGTKTRTQVNLAPLDFRAGPGSRPPYQAAIHRAKITCDQFTLYKVTDPQNIAIWLSGYYHGKRDNTLVDTQELTANMQKITSYCRLKPQETVMHAVETVFGRPKQ